MSQTTPAPASARRALVDQRNAVFAIFFLTGFSMASWVARIPAIRDATALSTQGVGLVVLACSIGAVVGLIAAPWLLSRFGARLGMLCSLAIASAGLVLVGIGGALTPSIPLLATALALYGLGGGAANVMMNVEGAIVEREAGRTLMPLMHAFASLGTVAGAGLAVAASFGGIPVSAHLAGVAAVLLVGAVIALRSIPRSDPQGDGAPDDARRGHAATAEALPAGPLRRLRASLSIWTDGRLLLIGVVVLGMSFTEGSANDWLALAVVDGHGADATTGAAVFAVFNVSMTCARVVGGPLIDRFGRVPTLRVLAATGVAGLTLFIVGTEPWMFVVGTVLWAVGCALGFPVGMSAAGDVPDRRMAAARVSAVAAIGNLALLTGPVLLGFLGERYGILPALVVLVGLMLLAGFAAPAARERVASSQRRADTLRDRPRDAIIGPKPSHRTIRPAHTADAPMEAQSR